MSRIRLGSSVETDAEWKDIFAVKWFDVNEQSKSARARRDYDATELTVAVGEPVETEEAYGRWLLVRTASGARGWIPDECIA